MSMAPHSLALWTNFDSEVSRIMKETQRKAFTRYLCEVIFHADTPTATCRNCAIGPVWRFSLRGVKTKTS